jgi:peptidoglycan-associated lipoprotein
MSRFTMKSALKVGVALGAVAALSACASHKPPPPAPVDSTPPPRDSYAPPPMREGPTTAPMAPMGARPGSSQDFVVSAGDRVYFDYDQYTVRDDGKAVLDRQAQWLSRYPQVSVRIEGNADERGTEEYNFALAGRRAEAIKSYLVGHGVAAGRVSTISYGKERPIDDGTDEASMAKNRNAHTAITAGAYGG